MNYKYKVGFVGCGNMAKAIINGILDSGILKADEMLVSTPSISESYREIAFTNNNSEVLSSCEYVVLAVKPQIFKAIAGDFKANKCKCAISIMAGISSDAIYEICNRCEVIRIMPNTPCSIGEGVSAITSKNACQESKNFVESIFKTISKTVYVDEKYFDAVTSVSGSGPAYVYYFIKSMIDGGLNGGLSYEQSKELTLSTVIGAAKMVAASDEDIQSLIQKVCSKGGTTIQAIDSFSADGVDKSIIQGIDKCRKRSEELSKQ